MTITRSLRIRGHVQGVGFRMYLQREAQARGVAGWVRNRTDGSVEAVLHGSREAVEAVTQWARHGPSSARVSGVEVLPGEGEYRGFELRRTE